MRQGFLYYLLLISALLQSGCKGPSDEVDYTPSILPEFNICEFWNPDMSWSDFQQIRTDLKRKELIRYVNKIEANKWIKAKGLPVVPTLFSSNQKDNFIDIIKNLSAYVAKPAHMSQNNGLVIVKNGINIITGEAISPGDVQDKMHTLIDTPSNSNEWLLQNMPRGFLIQEFIEQRQEIKIQTIWGRAEEVVWVQGGNPMIHSYYDINGETLSANQPFPFSRKLLQDAIAIAEKIAVNSDALRVDILVRFLNNNGQDLLVNELELRSQIPYPRKERLARKLNQGYQRLCEKDS